MNAMLNHPAIQSLVLPPLVAWLAIWLLGRWAGPRWAPLGAALGLLAALAVLPGFDWPALSRVQKLPWTVLAGTLVAGVWLWKKPVPNRPRMRGVALAAALTVAALGLAAFGGLGGSLLLAQLALMVAATTAVLGLWVWWRPASGLRASLASLLPGFVAGLFIAVSLFSALPDQPLAGEDGLYYTPQWK
ncbi:hypothetical protein [Hydrogenophaga sp.]|uniref:hypothetical protein n=1 Tax=Hydrogenophaga sp. TaxID=1904254 RepID=UPI002726B081|nr:hypothetical protein [Hydrogenophaga sp.]MDO9438890.1 hypothetical protein [Hydrogenophaga sp.]